MQRKRLSESVQQTTPMSVDLENGWVRGAKVLGLVSLNGREYAKEAVAKAVASRMYEGAKMNLDHSEDAGSPRRVVERFGRIHNARTDELGEVWGDIRFNPHHEWAKTFAWWAVNDPGAISLSHVATGTVTETKDGVELVTEIHKVISVDIVSDGATTKGLNECCEEMDTDLPIDGGDPAAADTGETYESQLGKLIVSVMSDESLDSAGKKKKVLQILKLAEDDEPAEKTEKSDDEDDSKEDDEEKKDTEESLRAELDVLRAEKKLRERRNRVRDLCIESKLHPLAITDTFVDLLSKTTTDEEALDFIKDRKKVFEASKRKEPISIPPSGGNAGDTGLTVDTLVSAVYEGR